MSKTQVLDAFLPPVRQWFRETFGEPTAPQTQGWPAIQRGEHTLILAPTGSGKTLAAFLCEIDNLFREPEPAKIGGVRLLYVSPLKALNNDGEGSTSQLIRALNYIGQNAKAGEVVNMSLGTDTISQSLDNAVLTLAQKGILFSIAAGNDSKKASLSSPGRVNHPNVFTVSAIDSLGKFASFSDFGNDVVDFAAPGVRIVSTYSKGRYAQLSVTSMAAPHVAGILVIQGTNIHSRGTALNDPDGVADPIASY